MKRIRWLIAEWFTSVEDIYKYILDRKFSIDNNNGFQISKYRDDLIEGRYIERREFIEVIEDPFGHKNEMIRYAYDITSFTLSRDKLSVELINPARRLSSFLSSLSDANNNKMTLNTVKADVQKWIDIIQNQINGFVVTHVDCTGLAVAENIVAKFSVSGSKDVRRHLHKLAAGRKYLIETAKFNFLNPFGELSTAEISKTGSAKIDTKDQNFIVPIIKSSLSAIC